MPSAQGALVRLISTANLEDDIGRRPQSSEDALSEVFRVDPHSFVSSKFHRRDEIRV